MHDKSCSDTADAPASSARLSVLLAPVFCVISMFSIQLGGALSRPVLAGYGTLSTTWLRLCVAALILLVIVRPSFRRWTRARWRVTTALGVAMAGMTYCYFESVQHVPMGLTVAINFMGPLVVSVAGVRHLRTLLWPALAALGVVMLARHDGEWAVDDLRTLLYPAGAAVCWALYIILMKHTGGQSEGLDGLTASVCVAALVFTPFALMQGGGHITAGLFFDAAWLALLVPLVPYVLELTALRHMTSSSFGTLMSAEPAVAAMTGYFLLSQSLGALQTAGVLCVVAASAGAVLQKQ
ncbi:DMT family transporter [Pantoea sp. S62]|uniref:EamA family transporter n=1 Tax=Pantoea sp. S62 TaxID=2769342 RepID=UPI0019136364|nr:EamA family transporter [Pantoea sp. S62]MBK5017221.1 EamA family transporter [Pantoea sp. S62]